MASELVGLTVDAVDPARLASFWAGILRREVAADGVVLLPGQPTEFPIRFLPVDGAKVGRNQMHFDLTSESLEDQQATVDLVLELGGTHLDIGQGSDVDHVVMADPEGNELCVIPPGNTFLAGCPRIGAFSGDGSQAVGYFWSHALDWPLVWDQDEETAVQSPVGGSKISWGGPPYEERQPRNRLHFDLSPSMGGTQPEEAQRLVGLGASIAPAGACEPRWVAMLDPDGNQFCLTAV